MTAYDFKPYLLDPPDSLGQGRMGMVKPNKGWMGVEVCKVVNGELSKRIGKGSLVPHGPHAVSVRLPLKSP
jgi:hypothetical protein